MLVSGCTGAAAAAPVDLVVYGANPPVVVEAVSVPRACHSVGLSARPAELAEAAAVFLAARAACSLTPPAVFAASPAPLPTGP